jgi:hypothetical protein
MMPIHFHQNPVLHTCHQDHPASERKGPKNVSQRKNIAPVRTAHRSAAAVLIVKNIAKTLARIAMKLNVMAVTASTLQNKNVPGGLGLSLQSNEVLS